MLFSNQYKASAVLVACFIAIVLLVAPFQTRKNPRQLHVDRRHSDRDFRRLLDQMSTTALEADAYDHLVALTTNQDGEPNPRLSCTLEYKFAADYVQAVMQELGLVPLGNDQQTSYAYVVENSIDPELCPFGLVNLIGMVTGTLYPNEYVIYNAHLDGPNNDNPQTDVTRGIQGVTNVYDDGLAVAVGLAMAKQFVENPPQRSVIIMIDDGEEGFSDVGVIPVGVTEDEHCSNLQSTGWFFDILPIVTSDPSRTDCGLGKLGVTAWIKNPTVPLPDIKMVFAIDPLGSPFSQPTNALAAVSGELTNYGTNGTLNDWLDQVWPIDTPVRLGKVPRLAIQRYTSNQDSFASLYEFFCGDTCLPEGGIPSLWLAEPAFQKYHSGAAIGTAKDTFGGIEETNGTLPSPVYFSIDNMENFYRPGLADMGALLFDLVQSAATGTDVNNLSYNSDRPIEILAEDMENIVDILYILLDEVPRLPAAAADFLTSIITGTTDNPGLLGQAQSLVTQDLTSGQVQGMAQQVGRASVGLFISMDFFTDTYPGKEAYLDQTYVSDRLNEIEDEPSPTSAPTAPTVSPSIEPTVQPAPSPKYEATARPTLMDEATSHQTGNAFSTNEPSTNLTSEETTELSERSPSGAASQQRFANAVLVAILAFSFSR